MTDKPNHEATADCSLQHKDCESCGSTMNFIGQGLYECWKCSALELQTELTMNYDRIKHLETMLHEAAILARMAAKGKPGNSMTAQGAYVLSLMGEEP